MKDIEKNILSHNNCLGNNPDRCFGEKRIVQGKAEQQKAGPEKKDEAPPTVDINTTDFDNQTFGTEKTGSFGPKGAISRTIKDIVDKIPNLDSKSKETLKNDFKQGIIEDAEKYKNEIAQTKGISGVTQRNTNHKNIVRELWFNGVLRDLKCNKIGIVHDIADDTTKFKFYSETGEILFKQMDISIQYKPENLEEKATRTIDHSNDPSAEIPVTKETAGQKTSKGAIELFKKAYEGREPKDGDRFELTKVWGTSKSTGSFNAKKDNFYTDTGSRLWLHKGDKIKFTPKEAEKSEEKGQIPMNGKDYRVLIYIDSDQSYLDIAKAIIDGGTLPRGVHPTMRDWIKKTDITAVEYADLLRQAHLAVGKNQRLPIVEPKNQNERKQVRTERTKRKEASEVKEKEKEGKF